MTTSALFTDFYELTMAQGYWKREANDCSVFDMFFRRNPFGSGFSVFAGLAPLLAAIKTFRFSPEDIGYLETLGIFERGFLDYLAAFRFTGDVYAMDEGTIAFPNEPLVRVHAPVIEAIIIEGMLLNIVNFQSLIATKSARIWLASNRGKVLEFGLRRAQGYDGAMSASRAAYIGGIEGTSNALAGKRYGIPVLGTMAHSWVMSFPNEEAAFDAYAELYPDKSTFLIDTYNTLESGIRAAIASGRRLAAQGKSFGVRLDSGDIQYLSARVREELDRAGFTNATITVSNELTEEIIESLVKSKSPIDWWGVGTHMVTGGNEASFTGVYKLAAKPDGSGGLEPTMKLSDNPEKTTNPGVKQVWRLYQEDGSFKADVLALEGETIVPGVERRFYHPSIDHMNFPFAPAKVEPLLKPRILRGEFCPDCVDDDTGEHLREIRARVRQGLDSLDPTYLRFLNPHIYKVSLTSELRKIKRDFLKIYEK